MEIVAPGDRDDKASYAPKKKKISLVEVAELLKRKKAHTHFTNRRKSSSARSSKFAYSTSKCGDDRTLESLDCSQIECCVSDNVGVRSMSLEFSSGDRMNALVAAACSTCLREAGRALTVLERALILEGGCDLDAEPPGRKWAARHAVSERLLFYSKDAGYEAVVPCVTRKLLNEREMVYNVFRKITCELESDGSYDELKNEVNAIIEGKEKECSLEVNFRIWFDLAKRLRDMHRVFQEEYEVEKQMYLEKIAKLSQQIDTSFCANNETLDYTRRTEESKLEQQILRQTIEEEALLNEIRELEMNAKKDAKASKQLLEYLNHAINDTEYQILLWSSRYNDELERRQQIIMDLEEKMEKTQEFLDTQRSIQADRQVLLDEYFGELQKAEEEAEYLAAVNAAATLIQAKWRGYMVRHQLGVFAEIFKRQKAMKAKKDKKSRKEKKSKK